MVVNSVVKCIVFSRIGFVAHCEDALVDVCGDGFMLRALSSQRGSSNLHASHHSRFLGSSKIHQSIIYALIDMSVNLLKI